MTTPADMTPGQVLQDWPPDERSPARRHVYVRKNPRKRSGIDISHETLRTCDFCPAQEWVKDLSRSSRWSIQHVGWFINITACPDHQRETRELANTLPSLLRDHADAIKAEVRARMDTQDPG